MSKFRFPTTSESLLVSCTNGPRRTLPNFHLRETWSSQALGLFSGLEYPPNAVAHSLKACKICKAAPPHDTSRWFHGGGACYN